MASDWPPSRELALVGDFITLRAYESADARDLDAALDDDLVWAHIPSRPEGPEGWDAFAAKGQANGRWMWVARLNVARRDLLAGAVVGCSSYYDVSLDDAHLTIGYTLFRREVWRDVVNAEAKLLMLRYAFEVRGLARVEFRVDNLNKQSQAAVLASGARLDGVLRRHQRRSDGTLRDSMVFSILADEWPAARDVLCERISRRAGY